MKLEEQYIKPASTLMANYIDGEPDVTSFFSCRPEMNSFEERLEKLSGHPADRQKLASVVRSFMQPNGISPRAESYLEALAEDAPVVIAGQQAGLLTGPLYTVHKAISVLVLAKQATEQLGRTVVPVFWIAGEDHDFAEISHFYLKAGSRIDKLNVPHIEYGKQSASAAELNKETVASYLEAYFRSMPETAYSKELHAQCTRFLEASTSFTDFFACFLQSFFGEEGLLYIDAANPELRRLESSFFAEMIHKNKELAESVVRTERELQKLGYPAVIGAEPEAANLFISVNGERILLQREGDGFTGNDGAVRFSREELLEIAAAAPDRLSNNVVTRPIMQEMVFPVLAFIGGPGEIAYWAALKDAFRVMDMEMPVIMPRLNMTIVDRRVQGLLGKYGLTFREVVEERKIEELRAALWERHREAEAEEEIDALRTSLEKQYDAITGSFRRVSKGLQPIVEKNLQIHLKQVDFLSAKLEEEVLKQHQTELDHFTAIEQELLPEGSLQERIFTPFPYMNEFGLDLVKELAQLDFKYDKNHKVIYI